MSFTCHCCSSECRKSGSFRNKNRIVQRFYCGRCGKSFSEAQPLNGLRVEQGKVVQIVKLLTEGVGIRAASRLTGCHTHTVLNVLSTIGEACASLHDKIVRNLSVDALQLDEAWSKVGISQKRTMPSDIERGDQYTYLALAAREKLIVSYYTGKRGFTSTNLFIEDLASRVRGRVQITSDSFRPYQSIVRRHLLGRLDFATMQKLYALPYDARGEAIRRYAAPRCTGVRVRIQAGAPREDRINTAFVERGNLTVRHFNKRFARLGLGWSRKFVNHCHAISLFVAAFNFCKVHSTLGCTPAVGAKLATETWTIERLIEEAAKC